MAENQRREIFASIPSNGSLLEWGSGGTTLWLLQNMAPNQRLVSVEHHHDWYCQINEACKGFANGKQIYVPGEAGTNATPWEECPALLAGYINAVDVGQFDCFLIDGVARGACLANVLLNAKSGAKVFLHDLHRDWYDWIIRSGRNRLCDVRVIEADAGDYPPPLWAATLK
jgi:hypothetical protein